MKIHLYWWTLNTFWQTAWRIVLLKIVGWLLKKFLLYYPKVHWRFHKRTGQYLEPFESSPHRSDPSYLRPILIFFSYVCRVVSSLEVLWLQYYVHFLNLPHACYMSLPSKTPNLVFLIIFGEKYAPRYVIFSSPPRFVISLPRFFSSFLGPYI